MNAYELAKKLEWYTNYPEFVEAGVMLRQQADRITELEKAYLAILASLPSNVSGGGKGMPQTEKFYNDKGQELVLGGDGTKLFKNPPAKTPTDEEIIEVMNSFVVFDFIGFARAILRKAQEK